MCLPDRFCTRKSYRIRELLGIPQTDPDSIILTQKAPWNTPVLASQKDGIRLK